MADVEWLLQLITQQNQPPRVVLDDRGDLQASLEDL
jgi:hypothetical protein